MSSDLYPALNQLFDLREIPENLGFLQDFNQLIEKLFYKNLEISYSSSGDILNGRFILVNYGELGIDIPGTNGLKFIVNPSETSTATEIPLQFTYIHEIKKFIEGFSISNFAGDPMNFFKVILDTLDIDEIEVLNLMINTYSGHENPIQAFVDDYNYIYGDQNLVIHNQNTNDVVSDLFNQINNSGIDVLNVVLNNFILTGLNFDDTLNKIFCFFQPYLGYLSISEIKKIIFPKISIEIENIGVALRFPHSVFKPVDTSLPFSLLTFNIGKLSYTTEDGIEFENENSFDFTHSEISNTGITISLQNIKVDLSRTKNITEADLYGHSTDFVGIYISEAFITLPSNWFNNPAIPTAEIFGQNMLIGTGGISGNLGIRTINNSTNPVIPLIGDPNSSNGFYLGITEFDVELYLNSFVRTNIKGKLRIPGFNESNSNPQSPAVIDVELSYDVNGDLTITASIEPEYSIEILGVLKIGVKSISVSKKEAKWFLALEGNLHFIHDAFTTDPIDIKKLIIWSDGRIEIEGGTLPLPKAISLKVGPVNLSITAIHFGSYQTDTTKFNYIGFDGGISLNPGGAEGKGKGCKFYYPVNDPDLSKAFFKFESLEINIIIPGDAKGEAITAMIKGFLGMKNVGGETEYHGGIELKLPKAQIAGGAAMALRPRTPAFLIDCWLEMSVPIVLGSTGLGIYGFRGLLGIRYVATKQAAGVPDDGSWFDYYKAPEEEGVHVTKFEGPNETKNYSNPFSIGAGVSLATSTDSGYTFSSKLFILLSLPNVLYLEGKANILGDRVGLTGEDPIFFAFIALSQESVEAGFGAQYKIPSGSGGILSLNAEVQAAYFFHNSSAWYINFGTRDKPTYARIYSLFDATAFLMFSASGIEAGAKVSYEFKKDYVKVVKAHVKAYLEVGGWVSFARPQIAGFIAIGGSVDVSLFGIGVYLSLATSLSVEVPKPYYIRGSVELEVSVTILKKSISKRFNVEFNWTRDTTVDTSQISLDTQYLDPVNQIAIPQKATNAKAVNIHSQEAFDLFYFGNTMSNVNPSLLDNFVIPLDSYIDIEFIKNLIPNNVSDVIGGVAAAPINYEDLIPPQSSIHQVTHRYKIEKIELKVLHGNVWKDYHPHEAMAPPEALAIINANRSEYKWGFWQIMEEGKYSKIRLLAQTPLSYLNSGEPGWVIPEEFGMTTGSRFCITKKRQKKCVNWANVYRPFPYFSWQMYDNQGLLFKIIYGSGNVINFQNQYNINRSLWFHNYSSLEIILPEPSVEVELKLFTYSSGLVIKFYKQVPSNGNIDYHLIRTDNIERLSLYSPVTYESQTEPIKKITIEPLQGDTDLINQLQEEINQLTSELYTNINLKFCEIVRIKDLISEKQKQILEQQNIGCVSREPDRDELAKLIKHYEKELKKCRGESISFTESVSNSFSNLRTGITKFYNEAEDGFRLMTDRGYKQPDPSGNIINNESVFENKIRFNEQLEANLNNRKENKNDSNDCVKLEDIIKDLNIALEKYGSYVRPEGDARCSTLIQQVCWLSVTDSQFNENIPSLDAIQADYQSMVNGIENSLSPIWRPDCRYLIHVEISDTVNANSIHPQHMYFGFRTAGPVGHFHHEHYPGSYGNTDKPLDSIINPEVYQLTNIKGYIDYQKSYPDADGNLINAKPLFYQAAVILLFYIESYVYHMFSDWPSYQGLDQISGSLKVIIRDPVEDVDIAFPIPDDVTTYPQTEVEWVNESSNENTVQQLDINLMNNLLLYSESDTYDNSEEISEETLCIERLGTPITPPRLYTVVTPRYLKPLKLYTALFFNNFKNELKEVHRYVFQTSRYADFKEQVNSYHIDDGKGNTLDAVFYLEYNLGVGKVNLAYDIIMEYNNTTINNATVDLLKTLYADPFERLIFGLELQLLPTPITTEFNIIKDSSDSDKIVAFWLRNPEPFNDPKIPHAHILRSIEVIDPANSYRKIYSKDRSQCILMNDEKNISPGDYVFKFIYLEWDGYNYVDKETVMTEPITIS